MRLRDPFASDNSYLSTMSLRNQAQNFIFCHIGEGLAKEKKSVEKWKIVEIQEKISENETFQ